MKTLKLAHVLHPDRDCHRQLLGLGLGPARTRDRLSFGRLFGGRRTARANSSRNTATTSSYYCNVPDFVWKEPATYGQESFNHFMDLEIFDRAFVGAA